MRKILAIISTVSLLASCGHAGTTSASDSAAGQAEEAVASWPAFSADSAYAYLKRQVEFGPRVPNTPAHEAAAAWLASELGRHGAEVTLQKADLKAWDGTILKSTNIFGSFNPQMDDRLLLLAHYDTRPMADQDADPTNHDKAIDGANERA